MVLGTWFRKTPQFNWTWSSYQKWNGETITIHNPY
jgi:hypothetical protein